MEGTKTLHRVFTVVFTYQCILLVGALLHETFVQNNGRPLSDKIIFLY